MNKAALVTSLYPLYQTITVIQGIEDHDWLGEFRELGFLDNGGLGCMRLGPYKP